MIKRKTGYSVAAMAVLLSFVMMCSGAAASNDEPVETARQPLTMQQKQEDLDFLCRSLEEKHPDLYANISPEEFEKAKNETAAKLSSMDDVQFAVAIQLLTAKAGDSHTSGNIGAFADQIKTLPFRLTDFGGSWILSTLEKKNARYLGASLTAVNGRPIDEVEELLSVFVSHDNEIKARRQFPYNVVLLPVLKHFGIAEGDGPVTLSVRTRTGKEETFVVEPLSSTAKGIETEKLSDQIVAAPKTAWDRTRNYWFTVLNPKTLYIQYNVCRQDENLPMKQFLKQVDDKIKLGYYSKIVVDLRNNGGGSDGVLLPLILKLQQRQKEQGFHLYTLIGETTFSSAIINSVELDVLTDTTLVGTPTSGSVNHFGSVNQFLLPHSQIKIGYSTKYIDLDRFMADTPLFNRRPEKTYGNQPLFPELEIGQTFEDYLAGRDTAVEAILDLKVS